jgi:hypothetical protein
MRMKLINQWGFNFIDWFFIWIYKIFSQRMTQVRVMTLTRPALYNPIEWTQKYRNIRRHQFLLSLRLRIVCTVDVLRSLNARTGIDDCLKTLVQELGLAFQCNSTAGNVISIIIIHPVNGPKRVLFNSSHFNDFFV